MHNEIFLLEQKTRQTPEDKKRIAVLTNIARRNAKFITPVRKEEKRSDYPSVEDQLNIIDKKFNKGK